MYLYITPLGVYIDSTKNKDFIFSSQSISVLIFFILKF